MSLCPCFYVMFLALLIYGTINWSSYNSVILVLY